MFTTVTATVTEINTVSFIVDAQPAKAPPAERIKPAFHPTFSTILFHLHTLYLFTASDLKTLLLPNIVFGVLGSLSTALVPLSNPFSSSTFLQPSSSELSSSPYGSPSTSCHSQSPTNLNPPPSLKTC